MRTDYLFTSESVSEGHPDKVSDQISDAIVDLFLEDVNVTLAQRHLRVEVSPAGKEWLLRRAGIDASTGARPLRRTIQRHVQDTISELLIRSSKQDFEVIEADVDGLELTVRARPRELEPSRA